MAKKKTVRSSNYALAPIHPSLHFIIFLVLAFVLVMVVAVVMQRTSQNARATLMCPQSTVNQKDLIAELSARCPQGVEYVKDANNCGVWVCQEVPTE